MSSTTSEARDAGRELQDGAGLWPSGESAAERADEGLHYGWAWQRYRGCYRAGTPLRVLDAGCGTGHSTAWLAKLNPGARVLGMDASAAALEVARRQTHAAGVARAVTLLQHDLARPIPPEWGPFDFVVCRGALSRADEPSVLLSHLAQVLDPAGLLLVSLPSRDGRQVAHALRQAVDALAPHDATSEVRLCVAREVYRALLPDHPIRLQIDAAPLGSASDLERRLAGYLDNRHDWTLREATTLLEDAGLKFLYAATPWPWRADRVFSPETLSDHLRGSIHQLSPARLSHLIDALDPSIMDDEFRLHACRAGYEPPLPSWKATRLEDPSAFDQLVPELTGLGRVESIGVIPASGGRVAYQTISGIPGELDRMSALLLSAVDGKTTCGGIEARFASRMRAGDDLAARQGRWIDLADNGLLLLRPEPA